jgi:voltage-gated potassium channel
MIGESNPMGGTGCRWQSLASWDWGPCVTTQPSGFSRPSEMTGQRGRTLERARRLRPAVWRQVDPEAYQRDGLSSTNRAIVWIVALSSVSAILETEPTIEGLAPGIFARFEWAIAILFSLEYLVRLWAEGENPKYRGVRGRIRYLFTLPAIIDLIAFLPSLILPLLPGMSNFMLLRIFRLVRILRLARVGRFSLAMLHLSQAVHDRREELLLSLMLASFVLVFSASGMYLLEGGSYPEAFGSIPRAMWWSICTLTTVGYGDLYPHTVPGKILGAMTSIAGIGLIAMPTGILAAAFSDAFQRTRTVSPPKPILIEPSRTTGGDECTNSLDPLEKP